MIMGFVTTISVRISNLSANRDIFKQYAPAYNGALELSGFMEEISYTDNTKFKTLLFNSGNFSDSYIDRSLSDKFPSSIYIIYAYRNLDYCRYKYWNNFEYFNTSLNGTSTHLNYSGNSMNKN